LDYKDKQHNGAYIAQGDKGQSIIVVPKLNLIIVTKNFLHRRLLLEKV
jgi:hypothetical protein